MPTVTLHPCASATRPSVAPNGLPQTLQTPSGLAILEIQGSVLNDSEAAGAKAALKLGQLTFDQTRGYLIVGKHQRLTGEITKLRKPLAIIQRRLVSNSEIVVEDELEIVDIVHHKLLFAHRPEPMGEAEQ